MLPAPPAHVPSKTARSPIVAIDRPSFERGLVTLLPELHARAFRLSGRHAAAEDLVQDTVERALRFADQYERGTNLRAWAHQILFSVFVSRYRRGRREKNALHALGGDPCAWTRPEPFAHPDASVSLTRATRARIDALPQGFRAVIELVDLERQSYREAATHLGVPVGTVMSRLYRGRRMLAEGLGISAPARQAA